MNRLTLPALALCFTLVATLSACTKKPVDQAPLGPLSVTGTLVKAGQSLVRRGTHELIIGGKLMYYVESRTENLSDFEGQTVSVQGNLEANSTPEELPVLVIQTIKGLDQNVDLHRFEVPELNLRLGIPVGWQGSIADHTAMFMMPDEAQPLLTIRRMSGSTLPPGGSPLYIRNRRTTRITAGGGASDISILDKDTVILLHFDPALQKSIKSKEDGDIVNAQFERVLSSITFLSDKEATVVITGSGSGLSCGGVSGTVCPAGSFCDITDFSARSGQCKSR